MRRGRSPSGRARRSTTIMNKTGAMALLIFLLVSILSPAQENLGKARISGLVMDEAGAPVKGARIIAASLQSEAKLEAVTDKNGRFAIMGLGTGRWRITAQMNGFDDAVAEMSVSQIKTNPPLSLNLKRPTAAQAAMESGMPMIDKGNELFQQGDTDGALAVFREFQNKFPGIYMVRIPIAAALEKKGDPASAEAEYKGVLEDILRVQGAYEKDKSVAVRALSALGELAWKRGDAEAGRKYFAESLAVSPDDEAAAYNVAEIMFSAQNIDEAIRYYEMAVSIKNDWPKPYLKLGSAYLNKADYAKAVANFEKFLALDPDSPEAPKVRRMIAEIEKIIK